jgi:hypothetical protein
MEMGFSGDCRVMRLLHWEAWKCHAMLSRGSLHVQTGGTLVEFIGATRA